MNSRRIVFYDSREDKKITSFLQVLGRGLAEKTGLNIVIIRHESHTITYHWSGKQTRGGAIYRYDLVMGHPDEDWFGVPLLDLNISQMKKVMAFLCDAMPIISLRQRQLNPESMTA